MMLVSLERSYDRRNKERTWCKAYLYDLHARMTGPSMKGCGAKPACITCKTKIDKTIDFLRGWEEKMVSIFCLGSCGKVELSLGPNVARSEIYT